MIVVVGRPLGRAPERGGGVGGTAGRAAVAAARAGASVQFVGKVGDDPAGDAVVLALDEAGVEHAAILRDPSRRTPVLVGDPEAETADAETASIDSIDDAPPPAIEPSDREEWPALEAADVELALRYLPDFRGIVVADPQPPEVLAIIGAAATYAGAELVLVVARPEAAGQPAGVLLIEAPDGDDNEALGLLLGELGAAIDRGSPAVAAFSEVRGRLGWLEPAE